MSDICVPNSALESEEEFRNWYLRMTARLFPQVEKVYVSEIPTDEIEASIVKTFERILSWTNFIYNNDWSVIPYKNKSGRATKKFLDVISTACNILLSYYDIAKKSFARMININHSNILYYIRRHNASCMYKEYVRNYNKLLICLRDEGIISTIQG
jgi:hypothetical protein